MTVLMSIRYFTISWVVIVVIGYEHFVPPVLTSEYSTVDKMASAAIYINFHSKWSK